MGHVEHGWMLEAFDEDTAFLFDAQVERAAGQLRAPFSQPRLGRAEQSAGDFRVVLGLEETEKPRILVAVLVVEPVDLSTYATGREAIAARKEESRLAVLEKRILLRVNRLPLEQEKIRDPGWIVLVKPPEQTQEAVALLRGLDGRNVYAHGPNITAVNS